MLGDLARPELSKDAWLDFRDWVEAGGGDYDGFQYRLKTGDAMQDGPFAVLVKDTLLRAPPPAGVVLA
ncbi:MAG TPA: hypothetical protein VFB52_10470 [Solirubrobacterales bacterium]|nr:hypothetical protein [Solirubrobacterales bacterium]